MSNISLWVTSNVPCETSKSEIELPESAELEMTVRPLKEGVVEVSGIEFDWLTVRCRCAFESPISFTCFEGSPSVKMELDVPKTDLIIGEIIEVRVKLTNGPVDLKYLAMTTIGTASFEVIYHTTEELLGQRQLDPLAANEECEVRIAVAGVNLVRIKLSLFSSRSGRKIHLLDMSTRRSRSASGLRPRFLCSL